MPSVVHRITKAYNSSATRSESPVEEFVVDVVMDAVVQQPGDPNPGKFWPNHYWIIPASGNVIGLQVAAAREATDAARVTAGTLRARASATTHVDGAAGIGLEARAILMALRAQVNRLTNRVTELQDKAVAIEQSNGAAQDIRDASIATGALSPTTPISKGAIMALYRTTISDGDADSSAGV